MQQIVKQVALIPPLQRQFPRLAEENLHATGQLSWSRLRLKFSKFSVILGYQVWTLQEQPEIAVVVISGVSRDRLGHSVVLFPHHWWCL